MYTRVLSAGPLLGNLSSFRVSFIGGFTVIIVNGLLTSEQDQPLSKGQNGWSQCTCPFWGGSTSLDFDLDILSWPDKLCYRSLYKVMKTELRFECSFKRQFCSESDICPTYV